MHLEQNSRTIMCMFIQLILSSTVFTLLKKILNYVIQRKKKKKAAVGELAEASSSQEVLSPNLSLYLL